MKRVSGNVWRNSTTMLSAGLEKAHIVRSKHHSLKLEALRDKESIKYIP